jgi:hypothetical protein
MRYNMRQTTWVSAALVLITAVLSFQQKSFAEQKQKKNNSQTKAVKLEKSLKKFPESDANGDGKLSIKEQRAYRKVLSARRHGYRGNSKKANKYNPKFHPGWDKGEFPENAVFKKSPEEIKAIYEKALKPGTPAVMSFEKPEDGAYRIIGTGHSFMIPGYNKLRMICKAAGLKEQPLYTHCGGGITGSARYKWELENGIFDFEGKSPKPKLLASLANAKWDVMTWGPYHKDRPEFYSCWIKFSRKYHPKMKFYLSDAWPLAHMRIKPDSENYFTEEILNDLGSKQRGKYIELIKAIREKTVKDVYVLPTCDAMVLAAKMFVQGKLPEVEGLHAVIGKKKRSIWRDRTGHLGPGFDRLEGYVFYATIYRRSPELIKNKVRSKDIEYPGKELDQAFRKIAWQAVTSHPLSGVVDKDGDGIAD